MRWFALQTAARAVHGSGASAAPRGEHCPGLAVSQAGVKRWTAGAPPAPLAPQLAAAEAVHGMSVCVGVPQPVVGLQVGANVWRCAFVQVSAGSGHGVVSVVDPQPLAVLQVPLTRVKLTLPPAQLLRSPAAQSWTTGVLVPQLSRLGSQVAAATPVKTRFVQVAGFDAQVRLLGVAGPQDVFDALQAGVNVVSVKLPSPRNAHELSVSLHGRSVLLSMQPRVASQIAVCVVLVAALQIGASTAQSEFVAVWVTRSAPSSQASTVQSTPSSRLGPAVGGAHRPSTQRSAPLQNRLSVQSCAFTQPLRQFERQPSLLDVLPSSHCSPESATPSPQTGRRQVL
jgi:hypothetical protein